MEVTAALRDCNTKRQQGRSGGAGGAEDTGLEPYCRIPQRVLRVCFCPRPCPRQLNTHTSIHARTHADARACTRTQLRSESGEVLPAVKAARCCQL